MPIFQIASENAKQIALDLGRFANEAALRDYFAENLENLLGMRFLAKEYQTRDGRIDTLAIDEANAPVIIEYKWNEKDTILPQGLFYFNWLKENKRLFNLQAEKILGKEVKVNWEKPRVVLIAQGFDRYTMFAVREVRYVELIKYTPYKDGILLLETVYSPDTSKPITEKEQESEAEEKEDMFGVDYHLKNVSDEVKEVFYALEERLLALPSVTEVAEQKAGITYRTTKSFTRFEFGKTYIDVLLRGAKYQDPKGLIQDIASYKWGYDGRAKIKSLEDVEIIFDLIRQSYESTL